MLDICVVNAWLLDTRSVGAYRTICMADFKHDVAIGLVTARTAVPVKCSTASLPRAVPAQVNVDARYDLVDHFPKLTEVKFAQRCKGAGCGRKTKYMCRKCKVYLCIDGSDCFYKFHHK